MRRLTGLPSALVLSFCSSVGAQHFPMEMATVPYDPSDPTTRQPAGDMEHVKDVYTDFCFGLAAIPEPSTASLLATAGLLALRRRRGVC